MISGERNPNARRMKRFSLQPAHWLEDGDTGQSIDALGMHVREGLFVGGIS
jgi:hypothetical protein